MEEQKLFRYVLADRHGIVENISLHKTGNCVKNTSGELKTPGGIFSCMLFYED